MPLSYCFAFVDEKDISEWHFINRGKYCNRPISRPAHKISVTNYMPLFWNFFFIPPIWNRVSIGNSIVYNLCPSAEITFTYEYESLASPTRLHSINLVAALSCFKSCFKDIRYGASPKHNLLSYKFYWTLLHYSSLSLSCATKSKNCLAVTEIRHCTSAPTAVEAIIAAKLLELWILHQYRHVDSIFANHLMTSIWIRKDNF